MVPGGGQTLILADSTELSRLHLIRQGTGWKPARTEPLMPWVWVGAMTGATSVFPTLAATPGKAIVMGLDRSVVLLPASPVRSGFGSVKWLLGKPSAGVDPAPTGDPAGPQASGMLVAVDAAGRIIVLDKRTRGILAIDPETGNLARILQDGNWPGQDFQEHRWSEPAGAAPETTAAAPEAPAGAGPQPAPAAQPRSRLNPLAPPFVPGSGL